MNTYVQKQLVRCRALRIAVVIMLMSSLLAGIPSSPFAAEGKEPRFQSADEAAKALVQAARAHDTAALVRFLGPGSQRVASSGDPVSDRQARERFVQAYNEASRLESVTEAEAVLHLGKDDWPFPIPLVKDAKGWRFDVSRGREEILRRRIGRNELETIQVCLAYVHAQREYAAQDWNGDGVRQYAQKFMSTPGKRDGLFWETKADEAPSPLGPLAAKARGDGYQPGKGPAPVPFHGYLYRILKAQGSHAPGGAFSYVAKGRMIGGFALVAYPAEYRVSGVMTFIVNQDGVVHQRDLGPNTAAGARRMTAFDPDSAWEPVTTTVAGGGKVPPPTVDVLPNGLTLIVQEHRAADIVAVHLWVATGVRYESPETLGHAHFQEHMLFKGGAQAQIFTAALAPPLTHPDHAALKVMTAILGGGMASRFFSDLRDKQALAYSTGAQYPGRLDTSSFVATLGTAPANVPKAEAALKEHLTRIQNEPASAAEVAVARSYVVGSQAMDRRTNARQAWYLAAAELAGVGYEFFDIYAANVRKVTPADVQRVAKQYLGVLRTVIVQPP
jgi:Protein of unknown function (DUF2950)/Peptidase M16 inactive domain